MRLVTVATCNLNQWALDFEGNGRRIIESIRRAKRAGASYRMGPELEICGYGCEDHFLEMDTLLHSWQVFVEIIQSPVSQDILLDLGMPILHRNVRYNCRVFVYNKRILLIVPKKYLAMDGIYREMRWFTPWSKHAQVEEFYVPHIVANVCGQVSVPIGDAILVTRDTAIAAETCEELWTPNSSHIMLGLAGVDIFSNGSGSHHELRKLPTRVDLIKMATKKSGGIYLYANHCGCDGSRVYFDGSSVIAVNGDVVAMAKQFTITDVEVVVATVDLDAVHSFRGAIGSRSLQADTLPPPFKRILVDIRLTHEINYTINDNALISPTPVIDVSFNSPEEEIALGPSCWLWDYLRRSHQKGFFLPLSGGMDSCCTATIVSIMCDSIMKTIAAGNLQTLADLREITGEPDFMPTSGKEIVGKIFYTCFMGTENTSEDSRVRAEVLAQQIGANHLSLNMDTVLSAILLLFKASTGRLPRYSTHGGTEQESIALQNIQARMRMVLSYLFAQTLTWVNGKSGSLLVLGSSNVDESLRGYMTKYDCSSADVNPIGSICKTDLRRFLYFAADRYHLPILQDVASSVPTAELEPSGDERQQTDEEDMGMSYEELSIFGKLRKVKRCGPFSMYQSLIHQWKHISPLVVAEKVKRFFHFYGINRHKMSVITPSYHAEAYSADDNRFDLRQILYPRWELQFRCIDTLAAQVQANHPSRL